VLRRHRQPVAGAPGIPACPRGGRGPGVAVRPRLAAGPSAGRRAVTAAVTGGRRGTARRRHTLVPADAVRHIRLRNTRQLDGHALIDRPRAFHITIIPITLYNMFF
jgi:hypothetical protein